MSHLAPEKLLQRWRWQPLAWVGMLALLLGWQAVHPGALAAAEAVALSEPWRFVDESKPGAPVVRGELVLTNEQSPTAVAARFNISSTMQALALQLNDAELAGLSLGQVDELRYCTRLEAGPRPYAVTLQINIDADVSDGDNGWQGRLVYTPSYNGAVIQGEWQCWNTLVGKWWATGGPLAQYAAVDNPQPLGTLLARFPNLGIHRTYSMVTLKAGDGWSHFQGEASPVAIGVEGERIQIAFGDAPLDNQILLPVLVNESSPAASEGQDEKDAKPDKAKENQGKEDKAKEDKAKEDKAKEDKTKEDKTKEDKHEHKDDRAYADWGNADWSNVDWNLFDWESFDWDKIDWSNIDWGAWGWPELSAEEVQAFVEDVKQCRDQGWQAMGFHSPGRCVAYYAQAHALAPDEWKTRAWNRDWNNDDNGRDRRGDDD